jgi:hypothetical protein
MGRQLVRESGYGRGTGDEEVRILCCHPFQLLLLLLLPTYLAVTRGVDA